MEDYDVKLGKFYSRGTLAGNRPIKLKFDIEVTICNLQMVPIE